MGYYGRLELKKRARLLRKSGKSYNKIVSVLHLSKSTISDWCKDIPLTQSQIRQLLSDKKSGAHKGSLIAAANKKKIRLEQTTRLFAEGMREVGILSKRDRFISGVAFYSSEGTKTDNGCAFANSDPKMIAFMISWFKEFGNVSIDKFHAAIWIHENKNESKAKRFWSKTTRIPQKNFYKSYITENKIKSKKIRKNIHEFGVCTIYVSNAPLQRKLMGWIGGVLQKA